jgi:type III secretory pathway component EscV
VDDNRKIIIRRISRNKETGLPEEEIVQVSRASRWATYLFLIPIFIIMAIIGIFFFTAFLALFAVVAVGLAFRLWWLRRKLHKAREAEAGEYAVIEDAEIIEERTSKPDQTTNESK